MCFFLFTYLYLFIQVNQQEIGNDIDVVKVWDQNIFGENVTVCLIDYGIDYTHGDIKDNFVSHQSSYIFFKLLNDSKTLLLRLLLHSFDSS